MQLREPIPRDATANVVPAVSLSTVIGVVACVLLLSLGAQLRVPVPGTTVPMTLQSFAVLVCGFFAARRVVVSGLVVYLGLGSAGVPVFSPGSQGFAGETGGYLAGFLLGAWLIATLRGARNASLIRLVLAGVAGTTAIFVCGMLWRCAFFGGNVGYAVMTGFIPFAGKAALQLGVVVSMVLAVRSLRSGSAERELE